MDHRHHRRGVDEVLKLDPATADGDCLIYSSLLQKLGKQNALIDGRRVHRHLAIFGQDRRCTFLGNHLINMYGKCGSLEEARRVFESILKPNSFSWNTMISAYAQNGDLLQARKTFDRMPRKNVVSWNSIIAAYSQRGEVDQAKCLFDRMPERDVISWNSVITAYAQAGLLDQARELLEQIPKRDVASWNAMISAYSHHAHRSKAMEMFREMLADAEPDDVTFLSVIESCSGVGEARFVKEMFVRSPWRREVKVWNCLMNLFGCRLLSFDDARAAFEDAAPVRDLISWNTMIAAAARCGVGPGEAVRLFSLMDLEGQPPDSVCLINVLESCKSLEVGRVIHQSISGCHLELSLVVATSLVNMYGNCGCVDLAKSSFDRIAGNAADVTAWTAIVVANARNGHGEEALELFREFGLEGLRPDSVALLSILSACSHAGLLYSGREFFVAVSGDYGVEAKLEHYRCVIDLLARLGQLQAAQELISSMPYEPDFVSLITLLGACKTQGDELRGQEAARSASHLNPDVAAPYVYQVCNV